MTLIDAVPSRSLFEWRDQLVAADKIIDALNKPRPAQIGCRRHKPTKGVDLSAQRERLAQFLAWLAEVYLVACDDYELRNGAGRPQRELDKNWLDDTSERALELERAYAAQGDNRENGYPPWDEFWEEVYGRGPGNPGGYSVGKSRTDPKPPATPLRMTYPFIAGWWQKATSKTLSPKFAAPKRSGVDAEPFERNNPSARFFILVARYLNKGYDETSVSGAYDTVKRERRKKSKPPNKPPRVRE